MSNYLQCRYCGSIKITKGHNNSYACKNCGLSNDGLHHFKTENRSNLEIRHDDYYDRYSQDKYLDLGPKVNPDSILSIIWEKIHHYQKTNMGVRPNALRLSPDMYHILIQNRVIMNNHGQLNTKSMKVVGLEIIMLHTLENNIIKVGKI